MTNILEANKIINKYTKRAFWMNDPLSGEFKLFFLEMVTEIRKISGREFNSDITIEDLKRTLQNLTEKYPLSSNVSLNTVLKTLNAMQSLSQLGDLFSIASAVSISFMPLGVLFTGPVFYIFLKLFAPQRLKCGVIMGIGGLLASELYNNNPGFYNKPILIGKKQGLSLPSFAFGFLALLTGIVLFLFKLDWISRLLIGSFCAVSLILLFIWTGIDLSRTKKIKNQKAESDNQIFHFQINTSRDFSEQFRLDNEEARFLFSLLYFLTVSNINDTQDSKIKGDKRIWLDKWKSDIEIQLGRKIVTERKILEEAYQDCVQYLSKTKISLIFIECVLYSPFFVINNLHGLKIQRKERTLNQKILDEIGKSLNLDYPAKKILSYYSFVVQSIGALNILKKIAESVFSEGFKIAILQENTGPVSASTSLTFSSGESPDDKTEDSFQENSFIIAGGIVINDDFFQNLLQSADFNSGFILNQLARMETVLKIIIPDQKDPVLILNKIINKYINIRDKMVKLFNQSEKTREELKKSIHYFESSIRRIEIFQKKNE